MELYYRDLISEDATLEKLVDELVLLVQGSNDSAGEVGSEAERSRRERLMLLLRHLKDKTAARAAATDKALRCHPYTSAGVAFGVGLLVGWLVASRRSDR